MKRLLAAMAAVGMTTALLCCSCSVPDEPAGGESLPPYGTGETVFVPSDTTANEATTTQPGETDSPSSTAATTTTTMTTTTIRTTTTPAPTTTTASQSADGTTRPFSYYYAEDCVYVYIKEEYIDPEHFETQYTAEDFPGIDVKKLKLRS